MTRRTTLTICMLAAGTIGFTVVANSQEKPKVDSSGFKPVASVHGIMNGQMVVFNEMMNTVRNAKAKERAERMEGLAEALAELANVNQYNSDQADFQKWARELRDQSLQVAQEARNETINDEIVKQLAETIKSTCAACHDKYQQ
jgi:hypothetical protein